MNSVVEIGENICYLHKGELWWQGNNKNVFESDNKELNDMFDSLRYVSKYFGIICLVFLGIYAFAIIVAIMATVF